MFTAPQMPMAMLQAKSDAGPSTSRKHGSTTALPSAAASSSGRRPMRSDSAPNIGAARPRRTCSHRNAAPTVARSMRASRTNQMPRKVTRLIRAATARKLAPMTTRMRLSISKTPVIQTFRERLAEREGSELGVLPLRVQQRLALLADQHLRHLPEKNGVRAVHQALHHVAVERDQRVDEHRRAGGEARPVARLEAPLAALRAAERGGEPPVLGAQHVDRE